MLVEAQRKSAQAEGWEAWDTVLQENYWQMRVVDNCDGLRVSHYGGHPGRAIWPDVVLQR